MELAVLIITMSPHFSAKRIIHGQELYFRGKLNTFN
uniref:Uncharacterized protein n=1 Tax=Rhizophora mucronata TaxID=61149 RepID=A0A2P2QAY8_RHIMU